MSISKAVDRQECWQQLTIPCADLEELHSIFHRRSVIAYRDAVPEQ
jgi:hypothetical protein